MLGFGSYDREGIKLGISPNYSATLGLKTGCHGYFMLLDICRWIVYKVSNGILFKIIVITLAVVQHMQYLIRFGTYDNPGIKLGISPNYSGLKTGVMVTSCF